MIPTKAEIGTDQTIKEKYLFAIIKFLISSPGAKAKTKLKEKKSKKKQIKVNTIIKMIDDFIKKLILSLIFSIF